MFARLGQCVTRYWHLVILAWAVLVVLVRLLAPRWEDVTHDGDLAYLPAEMPSSAGQRLTEEAFPENRARSQIVVIVAREQGPLSSQDLHVADELGRRFHNLHGIRETRRGQQLLRDAPRWQGRGDEAAAEARRQAAAALAEAQRAFDEAIRLDELFAEAWHNRAIVRKQLGQDELAGRDRETAWRLDPALRAAAEDLLPPAADLPLVDVWTRHNEVFGSQLRSQDRKAQLVILQLSNEFMATDNIRVLERVEQELEAVRQRMARDGITGLTLGISGSAAVGGDMLRAAAESVLNTEWLTVTLVILILLLVYRAPLLITVPLVTIAVSLAISTGVLASLTRLSTLPGFSWWGYKVFTTTKIFIVVILFGAGTDFCIFLIARFREYLAAGWDHVSALTAALAGVSQALLGSALTTILGLAMMFFVRYGKYRNSGPGIGLALTVALLACLTLAPAILRALGRRVFWPFDRPSVADSGPDPGQGSSGRSVWGKAPGWSTAFWRWLARAIVLRPGRILAVSLLLMAPLACVGLFTADHVTFDLLNELERGRPSVVGSELLKRHFPVGEGGPVIVLAFKKGAGFGDEDPAVAARAMAGIFQLTKSLREVPGVQKVRSLAAPLGDPPQRISLLSGAGLRALSLREHRLTKAIFLAQAPGYRGEVTRFELILDDSPFSKEAMQSLALIDARLRQESALAGSFWSGARFLYTGTTAGIRDLRAVTHADHRRIQVLVVLAVFLVLLLILRRPLVCSYLILSVLLSYFVTIGTTELTFAWLYGHTFQGLDWKVPVFLFVILVAVGEDYNIYLVTRVFEEQARRGLFAGLREAIVRTGGIITSCGVIMAGTFVSMTSSTLRGIVELGFALSLGVLLDTFIVRTLLVPAFLSLWCRWKAFR